ncbi:hypothetical protein KDH_11560 [Dictyobacter sp. S3.2.2.5]|uniref:Uncharacterized protein n=1 Tax=Dictyobacter halimunensis TaxID=3026934 RepID=A0ABQ6FKT7_9CHLR|nr:hypothetical protein KDH_11560 [Dictyobacter sp. S3.2.2.5]
MLLGKLDNARTDTMGALLIHLAYLFPEVCIVLLAFCYDACPRSVACDTAQLPLPKAGYLFATLDELRGKDRTFDRLDGTHREIFIDVEVNRT